MTLSTLTSTVLAWWKSIPTPWWVTAVIAILWGFLQVVSWWSGKKPRDIVRRLWHRWRKHREAKQKQRRREQLPPIKEPFVVDIPEASTRIAVEAVQTPSPNTTGLSVVRLLGAKSSPIPFLDRAGVLADLEEWAANDQPFDLCVLGGDGGSGKTRLGVELCRRLSTAETQRKDGQRWKAGFLRSIGDLEASRTSTEADEDSLLLVVDYAETRSDIVDHVINLALKAANNTSWQRIRVLFLVRRPAPLPVSRKGPNAWVDALRPQGSEAEGVNQLLDEVKSTVLNDKELSRKERTDLFLSALEAFHPSDSSHDAPQNLSQAPFSQPLMVVAAAFLASMAQSSQRPLMTSADVFDALLEHEEKYWEQHWSTTHQFDRSLARQAVAVATLTVLRDEADAVALLSSLPAAGSLDSPQEVKRVAAWLRTCYPPPVGSDGTEAAWCGHLEPDRFGEHLVTSEIAHLSPVLPTLLSADRVGNASLRTWTVLERASNSQQVRELVGSALNDVLEDLIEAVDSAAMTSRSSDLPTVLAALLRTISTSLSTESAHQAVSKLSQGGYLITTLGLILAQRASDVELQESDPEHKRSDYAVRLLTLSWWKYKVGDLQAALDSAQRASNINRDLARTNPDTHTPNLADSLKTVTKFLGKSGHLTQALMTAQETVTLYRRLTQDNPTLHLPNLADSLNTLAILQAQNTQNRIDLDVARDNMQLAVSLYQDLKQTNPTTYAPYLAAALMNFASLLAKTGENQIALDTARQAADLYRNLTQDNPAAHTPDLAMALENLANHLVSNGELQAALETVHEAVALRRELAHAEPRAFGPAFLASLSLYADLLEAAGLEEEAATVRREREAFRAHLEELEED